MKQIELERFEYETRPFVGPGVMLFLSCIVLLIIGVYFKAEVDNWLGPVIDAVLR